MTDFSFEDVPTEMVASVRRAIPMAELKGFFATAFGQVAEAVTAAGGRVAGPPFGWYHGEPSDTVDVSAGFRVEGDVHTPDGGIIVHERRGGRAVVGIHVGSYEDLAKTYIDLETWMSLHSLESRGDMWEEYLSPPEGDPSTWQTRIVMPVD